MEGSGQWVTSALMCVLRDYCARSCRTHCDSRKGNWKDVQTRKQEMGEDGLKEKELVISYEGELTRIC